MVTSRTGDGRGVGEREKVKSGMVAGRPDVRESGIWEGDELNGISERGG